MTLPESNLNELAKQGDTSAIESLLKKQLNPEGIAVRVLLKNDELSILLEAAGIPNRDSLVPAIKQEILSLGLTIIRTVKIRGCQTDFSSFAWVEEFLLDTFIQPNPLEVPPAENIDLYKINPHENTDSPSQQQVKPIPQAPPSRVTRTTSKKKYRKSSVKASTIPVFQDAVEALKIVLINPVGGTPIFYHNIGKQRALATGLLLGIIYVVCFVIGGDEIPKLFNFDHRGSLHFDLGKFILFGIISFVSLAISSALSRIFFGGSGSFEADVFIAGLSLSPLAIFILFGRLLINEATKFFVSLGLIITLVYVILLLHTGCSQISNISEYLSPLATACVVMSSSVLSGLLFALLVQQ